MADSGVKARKRKPTSDESDLENQAENEKKEKKIVKRSATALIAKVLGVIFGIFLLYLFLAPSPIKPISVTIEQSLPFFDGVMEPNSKLQQISKIGHGKLVGPESFEVDRHGNLYTGLADGRIVKVDAKGEIVEIARTGKSLDGCGSPELEHQCGRPLGLQFDKKEENLLICDAIGLLKLNIASGKVTTLVPADVGADGQPFKFLNHLAIDSRDKVYFTDSSWSWGRKDWPYLVLEGGGQGRLLSYDLKTGALEVLLSGLYFPNGVALSPDEDFVVVTETTMCRVLRYHIRGARKGIYDIFAENLPGTPDNIRASRDGGYWVALPSIRRWPISLLDIIGPYPAVKSAIAKLLPKHAFESLVRPYGLILKLDYYGGIVASYHDPDGSVISHISEVYEDAIGGILYLGSFKNNFIGKLNLRG